MIEIFENVKKEFHKHGDKYFIDKSVLTQGVYVRVNKDFSVTEDDILVVKSNKIEEHPFDLYNWFRKRDFYSKIIYDDANKCIDTNEKKIHSINPFSLIMKRKSLPDVVDNLAKNTLKKVDITGLSSEQIFDTFVDIHFEKMEQLYSLDIDYKQYRDKLILKSKELIEYISKESFNDETRIKIFLDVELKEYEKFFFEYMKEKSFCDNKFNLEVEEKTMGALSYNNTLNPGKPTLLMRATSFKVPYRISIEDSILFYKLSLIVNDITFDLRENFTGTLFDVNGKGEVENYEFIIPNKKGVPYREHRILTVTNPLDIVEDGEETSKNRRDIERELNHNFLKGIIYGLYKIDSTSDVSDFQKTINSKFTDVKIFNQLLVSRQALKGYFVKNQSVDITQSVLMITNLIIDYEIKHASFKDNERFKSEDLLRRLWDKQISLLHHLSGGRMYKNMAQTIQSIYTNTKESFNKGGFINIQDDEAFYFLSGQVGAYLVSQSKAQNKNGTLLVPFLQAKKSAKVKDLILNHFEIYAHSIPLYSEAYINRVIQAILAYTPQTELKNNELSQIYKSGLIGSNVFYMKREKAEDKKEEQA